MNAGSVRCWRAAVLTAIVCLAAALLTRGPGIEPATSAVAAKPGVVFGGLTSQSRPIVVRVSPARTRVTRVDWSWRARCVAGPAATPETPLTESWTDSTAPLRFAINSLGRWASGRYTAGPFTDPATGVSETFTYKLNGRIRPGGSRMTGTIRATYEQSNPTGVIRTCNSSLITFDIQD